MKGVTEELIGYIVVVLVILTLSIFLISQSGLRGAEIKKSVSVRMLDESGNLAVLSLFNEKVDFVEKPYAEILIDAVLKGDPMGRGRDEVFYGTGIGTLNNTEIIPPLFENYLSGKWKLEIIIPNGTFSYGNISEKNVKYVYEQIVPVPEEKTGKIVLYIG